MGAYDTNSIFHLGIDVLKTTVSESTKKITAQLGSVVGKTTTTDNAEWWQQVGFVSRPPKPVAGKSACQALAIIDSSSDIIFATMDLRGMELQGQLDDGETCIYAAGSDGLAQARILLKKDGSINLFTKKGNTAAGIGLGIFVNTDGSISAVGPTGAGFQLGADNAIKLFNASAALQVLADGTIKLASKKKIVVSAPTMTLGGMTAQPVVNATDLTALVGLIATAITASAAPSAAAAVTAFNSAATALIAALTTTRRTACE